MPWSRCDRTSGATACLRVQAKATHALADMVSNTHQAEHRFEIFLNFRTITLSTPVTFADFEIESRLSDMEMKGIDDTDSTINMVEFVAARTRVCLSLRLCIASVMPLSHADIGGIR